LTAACNRTGGTKHEVAASQVVIPLSEQAGCYLTAYREWMGITPSSPAPLALRPSSNLPLRLRLLKVSSWWFFRSSTRQRAAECWTATRNFTFTRSPAQGRGPRTDR
jgi:hypothetical protein